MKRILLSLVLAFHTLFALDIIEDQAKVPLLNHDFKERSRLKIRLDNGLEAVIVSDPQTKESAAVLTVNAGSWDEPVTEQGIAHFLEHMLFMGTKKYPIESEYDKVISLHKGNTNAFTYNDMTSYMFSVNNDGFSEVLDRFASFFIEPLFNPSGVSRELKAIDQEYQKNISNDDFRSSEVLRDISRREHPFSHFSSGNEVSLRTTSQTSLKDFYNTRYSADRMRLFVFSNKPLEELKEEVVKDFSPIAKKDTIKRGDTGPIFGQDVLGKKLYIEPIQDKQNLTVLWELNYGTEDSKAYAYACSVLGDEGEGSLASLLKKEGLAFTVMCGDLRLSADKYLYQIDVELTDDGTKKIDTVIERIFQAIKGLKESGVSSALAGQVAELKKIKYQNRSRQSAFDWMMEIAFKQIYEPLATFPEKSDMLPPFDQKNFNNFLDALKPENAIYMILAPSKAMGIPYNKKQDWTETPYALEKYTPISLKDLPLNPELSLPAENQFIPKSFALKGAPYTIFERIPSPELLINDDKGRLWFAQDHIYQEPKLYAAFEIKTPLYEKNKAMMSGMADLYKNILTEELNKITYEALSAELEFTLELGEEGFVFIFNGFDEKVDDLLKEVFERIRLPGMTEDLFNLELDSLKREYQNFSFEPPYKQDYELFESAIYKNYTTRRQKGDAIKNLTYEKFKLYVNTLFKKSYVQGVVFGNTTPDEAKKMWGYIEDAVKSAPFNRFNPQKSITLPAAKGPFMIERTTKAPGNALILSIEDPDYSFKKRAAQQILGQGLRDAYFAELRTKQQTGYIVASMNEDIFGNLFSQFLVQSATHTPQDLLYRTEEFLESYLQDLDLYISKERFETFKQSLIDEITARPKSIEDMGSILKLLAFRYNGDFEWLEKRVAGLKELTYEEFQDFAKNFLGRRNKRRIALLMKSIPLEKKIFHYQPLMGVKKLKELSSY